MKELSSSPTRAEVDDQLYELHASVCQVLANPTRLKVLNALRDEEIAVTELARRVGASLPNLSRHLAILKARRVVLTRRQGVTVYYRLANPKILRAFDIMREVLFEHLAEGQRLVAAYAGDAKPGGARTRSRP
jgi:ArsR family transcriptional regulator